MHNWSKSWTLLLRIIFFSLHFCWAKMIVFFSVQKTTEFFLYLLVEKIFFLLIKWYNKMTPTIHRTYVESESDGCACVCVCVCKKKKMPWNPKQRQIVRSFSSRWMTFYPRLIFMSVLSLLWEMRHTLHSYTYNCTPSCNCTLSLFHLQNELRLHHCMPCVLMYVWKTF